VDPTGLVGAEAARNEAVGDDPEIPEVVGVREAGDHLGHHGARRVGTGRRRLDRPEEIGLDR
jgi:hypothetical protein